MLANDPRGGRWQEDPFSARQGANARVVKPPGGSFAAAKMCSSSLGCQWPSAEELTPYPSSQRGVETPPTPPKLARARKPWQVRLPPEKARGFAPLPPGSEAVRRDVKQSEHAATGAASRSFRTCICACFGSTLRGCWCPHRCGASPAIRPPGQGGLRPVARGRGPGQGMRCCRAVGRRWVEPAFTAPLAH